MNQYETPCDICGKPICLGNYHGGKCDHCGQKYDYDEGNTIQLTEQQLQLLRADKRISVKERLPEDGAVAKRKLIVRLEGARFEAGIIAAMGSILRDAGEKVKLLELSREGSMLNVHLVMKGVAFDSYSIGDLRTK